MSGTLQAVSNPIGTVQSQGVKSFSSMPMSSYPNKGSAFSSHPNSVNVLQAPVVWVISDVQGLRQHVFLELGAKVINVWFDLHSKGQLESLQNSLESQRPELVWVRLHGPCIGSGNRRDNARAQNLSRIISLQSNLGGKVLLEANVRSQAWNLQAFRAFSEVFNHSLHKACRYCPAVPCHMITQILSNFPLESRADCLCRQGAEHVEWKSLKDATQRQVISSLLKQVGSQALGRQAPPDASHVGDINRQPELNLKRVHASTADVSHANSDSK